MAAATTLNGIGARLRHTRRKKGMTMDALAGAAGIDKGFLSRLERGTKQPSIETVVRLSAALDVPIGQLFGEQAADDAVRISRSAGRPKSEQGDGYSFELLSSEGGPVDAFIFEAGPEFTRSSGQRHDGEEMFYVLAGTIEMRIPDRSYVLEAGDCAFFPGHLPHSMRRLGPPPATALIAVARERASPRRG